MRLSAVQAADRMKRAIADALASTWRCGLCTRTPGHCHCELSPEETRERTRRGGVSPEAQRLLDEGGQAWIDSLALEDS